MQSEKAGKREMCYLPVYNSEIEVLSYKGHEIEKKIEI